jgi:hypothetical protein
MRQSIISIVVKEFDGIDGLPDDPKLFSPKRFFETGGLGLS